MDPIIPLVLAQPAAMAQPMIQSQLVPPYLLAGGFTLASGDLASNKDRNDYLSTLDSDTRDYVIKHTGEFSSKADIMECVHRLHEGS